MNRFELLVIVRGQVTDRALLRRYLAVEAAMEELAADLGLDPSIAALAGLGLGFDAQLCRHNPDRLGEVARELLATEDAPPEVGDAVLAARRSAPESLSALAAALMIAEALVTTVYAELDGEDPLDELSPRAIAMKAERAAPRAVAAARARGLALEPLAAHTLAGMRRIRADLGV